MSEELSVQDRFVNQRTVDIGDVRIPYYWGFRVLERLGEICTPLRADRFIVVSDPTIGTLYSKTVCRSLQDLAPVEKLTVHAGEKSKSWDCLQRLCNSFLRVGATRNTHIVALGGGAIGNLAGLAAALTFRGIPLIHVPTTLVAAFDSVLSLKQAINSAHGKNHFGTYHAPICVFADLAVFDTLPEREIMSGLGEVIKNVLAICPYALETLLIHANKSKRRERSALSWFLDCSISAKSEVLVKDTKEKLKGVVLEYGHTVGHAVEFLDARARGGEAIAHGEAVVLGMLVASKISEVIFASGEALVAQHRSVIECAELDEQFPSSIDIRELARVVLRDNKRGYIHCEREQVPMVLLRALGQPNYEDNDFPLTRVPLKVVVDAARPLITNR